MIYQEVTRGDFHDAFLKLRPDNFTYDGRNVLYDYLELMAYALDGGLELDVIALCCEYTEYSCFGEFRDDYEGFTDDDDWDAAEEHTTVIRVDGERAIIAQF